MTTLFFRKALAYIFVSLFMLSHDVFAVQNQFQNLDAIKKVQETLSQVLIGEDSVVCKVSDGMEHIKNAAAKIKALKLMQAQSSSGLWGWMTDVYRNLSNQYAMYICKRTLHIWSESVVKQAIMKSDESDEIILSQDSSGLDVKDYLKNTKAYSVAIKTIDSLVLTKEEAVALFNDNNATDKQLVERCKSSSMVKEFVYLFGIAEKQTNPFEAQEKQEQENESQAVDLLKENRSYFDTFYDNVNGWLFGKDPASKISKDAKTKLDNRLKEIKIDDEE